MKFSFGHASGNRALQLSIAGDSGSTVVTGFADATDAVPANGAGDTITSIHRTAGNFDQGNFNISYNAAMGDAKFTGTPKGSFKATGGALVVFDVTETAPTPSPRRSFSAA